VNKTYLIFRHEFLKEVKKASFIIMAMIVPVLGLLAIGIFKLIIPSPAPAEGIVQAARGPGEPNLANIVVPGVFALFLGLALMFGATSLISGLAEEKESRLIQVLFSSVSIRQLLVGKVMALGAAGLLQVLAWLVSVPLLLRLASSAFGGFMSRVQVPVNLFVLGIVYFILGYLLFAVLSIGVGAISSNPREGTNLSLIYTLGSFVPLWLSSLNMFFPNSLLWVVLTLFPVTAPVMTMLRLGTSGVPAWQIVTSTGLLALSIIVGLSLSIKVFRVHMLMYGKRPGLGEIVQSLKDAGEGASRAAPLRTERIVALDYLRSFGVLLVILHHAALAYVTFGYLNPADPTATFSPIVDSAKWAGFDLIVLLNDTFFMPLLFFVSGLFVWPSLERRGVARFLLGRLARLGIPFLIGVVVFIPVAFYPTMLEIELVYGVSQSFGAFWLDFAQRGFAPPGPMWFLWLLLAFDGLAALAYWIFCRAASGSQPQPSSILDSSVFFAVALIGLSFAAYLPMRRFFVPSQWLGIGPFQVEIVRVFLYLVYFAGGAAIGARGLGRGAFRADGPFARRWWAWLLAGVLSYGALLLAFTSAPQSALARYLFVVEMALVVLGLTAVFVRFARRRVLILDSLSANSYGIYLIHYTVVIWLQYALLRIELPAVAKGAIVFWGSVFLCWGMIAALRRIPAVARVI
jgi:ABC-type Na+ efflux pump permease subunit/surface polysaccharide O-acyltransferase-like enzyme